ncbi:hypothetical protein AC249_AIPGENE10853 [Exaiptasia diaphana]|nr:hypothetical protein AC249_AIPGENE10853 [Exaiptasia diaphana]
MNVKVLLVLCLIFVLLVPDADSFFWRRRRRRHVMRYCYRRRCTMICGRRCSGWYKYRRCRRRCKPKCYTRKERCYGKRDEPDQDEPWPDNDEPFANEPEVPFDQDQALYEAN